MKTATSSAINTMTTLCKLTVVNKLTENTTDTTNSSEHQDGLNIPEALTNNLCPGDCSGNGECVNSTCICSSEFIASDCSIGKGIIF